MQRTMDDSVLSLFDFAHRFDLRCLVISRVVVVRSAWAYLAQYRELPCHFRNVRTVSRTYHFEGLSADPLWRDDAGPLQVFGHVNY